MNAPQLPVVRDAAGVDPCSSIRRTHRMRTEAWQAIVDQAERAGIMPSAVLACAYGRTLGGWCRDQRFSIWLEGSRLSLDFDVDPRRSFTDCVKDIRVRDGEVLPIVFCSRLTDDWGTPGVSPKSAAWLRHDVVEDGTELVLTWDAAGVFSHGVVEDLVAAHIWLLDRLAVEPEAWTDPASDVLPLRQLLVRERVNDTEAPLEPVLLHELFWRQAARTPDVPAVITVDRTVSYRELRAVATRIAERLAALGARPNHMVAVAMGKGWEQVAAVLGILAAGAAYVPIDPESPRERLHHLLRHAEVDVALIQVGHADIDWPSGVQVVEVDGELMEGDSPEESPRIQGEQDLAYVIYTSGSTGLPKGVMIDHRGPVNTILDINRRWDVGPCDRVFALSSLGFDLSVYDIFGPLAVGGAVVMPAPGTSRAPWEWADAIEAHGVTIWNTVPALMEMLVEYTAGRRLRVADQVRLVLMSGDWIPVSLPDRIKSLAHPDIAVIGLGGATEASIWSNFHPIGHVDPAWPSIPYGTPLTNQLFEVLDSALRRVPDWVPGELHIGGLGVAMGYWRDEDKTNESFIHHPRTGQRLYRTGDLGRYLPDGTLEFLGREDFQVKIHGFRVELGEIESALLDHDQVTAAAVTAVDTGHNGKRLVAYVTPADASAEDLRSHLAAKLPAYLVPDHVIPLESFPLSSNGKVDRTALPRP